MCNASCVTYISSDVEPLVNSTTSRGSSCKTFKLRGRPVDQKAALAECAARIAGECLTLMFAQVKKVKYIELRKMLRELENKTWMLASHWVKRALQPIWCSAPIKRAFRQVKLNECKLKQQPTLGSGVRLVKCALKRFEQVVEWTWTGNQRSATGYE